MVNGLAGEEMGLWVDFKRVCRWQSRRCIKFQSRPSDNCITVAFGCVVLSNGVLGAQCLQKCLGAQYL